MTAPALHLASSSPRRRELLNALRLDFSFAGVAVSEARLPGESGAEMAARLAIVKARAAAPRSSVILAADTVVMLGDRVFGKPEDAADCVRMLTELSGRTHEVVTGVAVLAGEVLRSAVSRSAVRFRDIDPAEIEEYWQSGEPADKAGSYAIQGLGGAFVQDLRGSYSGVVGLPVYETVELLAAAGIDVLRGANASE